MSKILVAYSTAAGSTAEVAEAIGQELSSANGIVDLLPAREVRDLHPYQAVVLGTGIRAGRPYRETLKFVERHHGALSRVPVAYFIVCMTMKEDTPKNREQVDAYADQLRAAAPQVRPLDVGYFGGRMDFKRLPLLLRLIVKAMKEQEGDFRDWEAIRAWAAGVRSDLVAQK
jgi:menaquinone-dependent protoporphyrinogen oxidase